MAVMTLLEFECVDRARYEAVGELLAGGPPPVGIIHHACGSTERGWRIVDIWEDQKSFDRLVDDHYLPAMLQAGGSLPVWRKVIPAHHAGAVRHGCIALHSHQLNLLKFTSPVC